MTTNITPGLHPLAVPIESLKTLEDNPRRGNIQALVRSYARFGQRKPLVALKDGTVIAGNHQLAAARQLGWDQIAVVYVDDDETTAKAYVIADNRIADLGAYDDDLLAEALLSIRDDFDDLAAIGYMPDEIEDYLSMSGVLGDQEVAFLDEYDGPTASIANLDAPEHDMEVLTVLLTREKKRQVVENLREAISEHGFEGLGEALYYRVVG